MAPKRRVSPTGGGGYVQEPIPPVADGSIACECVAGVLPAAATPAKDDVDGSISAVLRDER